MKWNEEKWSKEDREPQKWSEIKEDKIETE